MGREVIFWRKLLCEKELCGKRGEKRTKKVYRDIKRYAKIRKDIQRLAEIFIDFGRFSEIQERKNTGRDRQKAEVRREKKSAAGILADKL